MVTSYAVIGTLVETGKLTLVRYYWLSSRLHLGFSGFSTIALVSVPGSISGLHLNSPSPFLSLSYWHTHLYFFVLISYHAHTNILFHMNDIITPTHTHTHQPPGPFYSMMCLETFWNVIHPLLTHGDEMLVHLSVTEREAGGRARSRSRHT